jgi:hypothetical protein
MGDTQSKVNEEQSTSPEQTFVPKRKTTLLARAKRSSTQPKPRATSDPVSGSPQRFRPRAPALSSFSNITDDSDIVQRRAKILGTSGDACAPSVTAPVKPGNLLRKTDACMNLFVPKPKTRIASQSTQVPSIYSSSSAIRSRTSTQTPIPPNPYTVEPPTNETDNTNEDSDDGIDWDAIDQNEDEDEGDEEDEESPEIEVNIITQFPNETSLNLEILIVYVHYN